MEIVCFRNANNHWRKHRKLLTPTFHFDILNKFIPTFNSQLQTLIKIIEWCHDDSTGKIIVEDVRPLVTNATVDIICETTMGIKVGAQNTWWKKEMFPDQNLPSTRESEYLDALRSFFNLLMQRLLLPWNHIDFIFNLSPVGRLFQSCVKKLHHFTDSVILERKDMMKKMYNINGADITESLAKLTKAFGFLGLVANAPFPR